MQSQGTPNCIALREPLLLAASSGSPVECHHAGGAAMRGSVQGGGGAGLTLIPLQSMSLTGLRIYQFVRSL